MAVTDLPAAPLPRSRVAAPTVTVSPGATVVGATLNRAITRSGFGAAPAVVDANTPADAHANAANAQRACDRCLVTGVSSDHKCDRPAPASDSRDGSCRGRDPFVSCETVHAHPRLRGRASSDRRDACR